MILVERSIRRPTAFCIVWRRLESNQRPQAYETCKLPTALLRDIKQGYKRKDSYCSTKLSYVDVSTAGLEPATHSTDREVCLIYGTCL